MVKTDWEIYSISQILEPALANEILMGKILSAAPAAIPIRFSPNDRPFQSGTLHEFDKSIRVTARIITRTRLSDKARSEIMLQKAGVRCLTEAVFEIMACQIWKARSKMNPLRRLFQNKVSTRNIRSANCGILIQPVPGHSEVAAKWFGSNLEHFEPKLSKNTGECKNLSSRMV